MEKHEELFNAIVTLRITTQRRAEVNQGFGQAPPGRLTYAGAFDEPVKLQRAPPEFSPAFPSSAAVSCCRVTSKLHNLRLKRLSMRQGSLELSASPSFASSWPWPPPPRPLQSVLSVFALRARWEGRCYAQRPPGVLVAGQAGLLNQASSCQVPRVTTLWPKANGHAE